MLRIHGSARSRATRTLWMAEELGLNYQHIDLASNVPLQGFSRDVVTVGLTYKY